MEDREKQIPAPKSWITFEDLCHCLFKAIWGDPFAQKNGRSGQPQHGVDVFGSPGGDYAIYQGVQCKGKDTQYGAKPSVKELECEISKAECFEPSLQHWIFATTAPVDGALQEVARNISAVRKKEGRFTVSVFGWGQIESLLCEKKEVLQAFYPEHGFDFAKLLEGVQAMPHGSEVRELLDMSKQAQDDSARLCLAQPTWQPVVFGEGRDLGPALMGRPLGPEDAAACPKLQETDVAVAELLRAFSARIVGEPGAGKSLCAYQAAKQFAELGWHIVRLSDPRADVINLRLPDVQHKTLFLVDDAHLTKPDVLRTAEEAAGPNRLLLSTHNAVEHDASFRGSIIIDAKRAVRTIAEALRSARDRTLEVVRRVDNQIGDQLHDTALEDRIDQAEQEALLPWQFCFILGGGWRRAKEAADTARAGNADIALAGVAIRQLASRDARPSLAELTAILDVGGLDVALVQRSVELLIRHRLLIGSHDLRCPHQKFASVVLAQILKAQNTESRESVGRMLRHVVADAMFPIAGLRLLLHELSFAGEGRQFTYLIPEQALKPLVERCWRASDPEEITFASLLLSELGAYGQSWPQVLLIGHEETVASWISAPLEPSGYGLARLLHAVHNKDQELAAALVNAADPHAVAAAISAVTPKTAYHLGELLSALKAGQDTPWSRAFLSSLDRQKLIDFATEWPVSEPAGAFANFCKAMAWPDEILALDMVEKFVPIAQKLLADDPIPAFRDLDDIAWHVLRMFDPLGIYVGRLAPKPRQRELAAKLLRAIKPSRLAAQLSASRIREFQHTSFLLAFMARAVPAKFRSTVALMDWTRIAETIGQNWRNLPHEAEVLIGVAYGAKPSRKMLAELISANLHRIEAFPPRLVMVAPTAAYQHVAHGRQIRLNQHDHVDWRFGTGVVSYFANDYPDLLEFVLAPSEAATGRVLSNAHPSWYNEAADYISVIAGTAPQILQRILDSVDVVGAEKGWAAALAHGGGPRKTVALLVQSSFGRTDELGALAQRLRARFPKSSNPVVDTK
ncbi:MAG: hypothetical protein C4583_04635 [Anaerolineaceae bacterium]|nr:MAG: hypothetical protein C4583_04635 [Anaerolineaceae bacterium]